MMNNKMMKMMMFFLIVGVSAVCSAVDSYSQATRLTLKVDRMTIKQALAEIEKQSEFIFFYYGEAIDTDKKVSVDLQNQTIDQILDQLLKNTGSTYTISGRQVYISKGVEPVETQAPQQARQAGGITVTGTVVDQNGEPLIGVSVRVKDTQTGVVSDVNGRFSLSVNESATLLFTYVGYQDQEVAVKGQRTLRIQMAEDAALLDEVIIMAYGTSTKESFTGSASVMKSDVIQKRQVTNVLDALKGQAAGVQMFKSGGEPDSTPTFLIRGLTSITAENDPLIILDGAPFDAGWNDINPNDVESVTVLKDAASNALYGARGAGGVIMVTTKSAAKGKATVTLDARYGVNNRVKNTYDMITEPGQYYEMQYKALNNYFLDRGQGAWQAHVNANNAMIGNSSSGGLGYIVYDYPQGEYLIGSNGRLNPNATLGRVINYNGNDYLIKPDNWYDEAFKTGVRQEYNLSVSGGGDKGKFYASMGYLNNEGIASGSSYERYSGRINASYDVNEWLTTGVNANYTRQVSDGISSEYAASVFDFATSFAPIYPLFIRHADGSYYTNEFGRLYDYGNGDNAGLQWPNSVYPNNNPLQTNALDVSKSTGNTLTALAYADIRFLKDFKLTININLTNTESRGVYGSNPWYGFSADNYQGYAGVSHSRTFSVNTQQLLNYTKTISDKHHINVLLGHEYYDRTFEYLTASKSGAFNYFMNHELDGHVIQNNSASSYSTPYNTEGFFARGMYDYDEKYFGSISYRLDGSSYFHPDHRWGNFWSVGGSWLINREEWFDVDWVDMLKLKASYGEQGNDAIGGWRYTDYYNIVNAEDQVALEFVYKGNKEISWEKNGNFNIGVEFDLFRNRLSGSIEYFYRKTGDMLTYFSTPPAGGYTGYYANVGDMKNNGVEVSLTGTVIKTKDLTWNINLNATHYKNQVTYLAPARKTLVIDGHAGYQSGYYFIGEGLPRYAWYLRKYAGVNEQGQATYYKYENADNTGDIVTTTVLDDGDYFLTGTDPTPDFYGGFSTNLTWKGFDFSTNFSYQIGGEAFDNGYASRMAPPLSGNGGLNWHVDVLNSWTAENHTNIPRWVWNTTNINGASTRWLTDASYLSMENITLGYTLPKTWLQQIGINSLRLSLACDNVFFISKRKGFDPRTSLSGEVASASTTPYSPMRSISGGIKIQF
jgi:TonB-linked SusC/RagA family outer membrane protein